MNNKKLGNILIKLAVSTGLFWLLISQIDLNDIIEKLSSAKIEYLLLSALLIVLNYIVSSYRWLILLNPLTKKKVRFSYLTSLYFTGSFFNNFMPTSIGGDVYKVLKLGKKIDSKTQAFSATFTERFLGVLVLFLISLAGFMKLYGSYTIVAILIIIILTIIGIQLLFFLRKKIKFIGKILDTLLEYKKYTNEIVIAFVLSLIVQLLSIYSQYLVFLSLGFTPSLVYSLLVLPVITLAGFFIPSLNGIGVQDALYVNLFGVIGIPAAAALTASILYHILRLIVSLIGGILYALGMDE